LTNQPQYATVFELNLLFELIAKNSVINDNQLWRKSYAPPLATLEFLSGFGDILLIFSNSA
jgi:hypothetical protein